MSRLEIVQIDIANPLANYNYLLHCPETGATSVVDPTTPGLIQEKLAEKGWTLSHILNTHHHNDHVGGNLELQAATGCTIVGPRADRDRIPGIQVELGQDDSFVLGNAHAKIYDIPGHTRGHIAYWFEESDALFCGDTLFALGCGRLFEGTPAEMWSSLSKFKSLPDQTRVYCAHEYTQSNAQFAVTIESSNKALLARAKDIDEMRAKGLPTVPSTLGTERATNPFLRADLPELARAIDQVGASAAEVFAEIRHRKDNF